MVNFFFLAIINVLNVYHLKRNFQGGHVTSFPPIIGAYDHSLNMYDERLKFLNVRPFFNQIYPKTEIIESVLLYLRIFRNFRFETINENSATKTYSNLHKVIQKSFRRIKKFRNIENTLPSIMY